MGVRKLPLFRHWSTSDGFPIEKERKKYETEREKLKNENQMINIYIFTWYDLAFIYLINIDTRLKTMQVIKGFERFIFNAFLLAWSLLFGVQS